MEFHGKKIKGKAVFAAEVAELRRRQWAKVQEGMTFKTSMVIPRKGKSQAQLGLIFGHMIASTVLQAEEMGIGVDDLLVFLLNSGIPKGQAITADYLHELMYIICPTTNENGDRVTLRNMNTMEASNLFERFRTIIAGIGIVIETPDELRTDKIETTGKVKDAIKEVFEFKETSLKGKTE